MGLRTVLISLLVLLSSSAGAQDATATEDAVGTGGTIGKELKTGLGLGVGPYATGLSGKIYLTPTTAIQGVVGQYGIYPYASSGISLGLDFVQEIDTLVEESDVGRLFWALGAGGGVVAEGPVRAAGVSGLVELGWQFEQVPLEWTLAWRPTFYVANSVLFSGLNFYVGGGALRYYF